MATSFPIILAHGICPFQRVLLPVLSRDNRSDDRFHYFRKIRSTLTREGFEVYHGHVSWAASLERRAWDLRNQLLHLTDGFRKWPKVHIIGHSMGGLDARWMIYRHQMHQRVASLTTIGTPHHGTPYADWGLRRFPWLVGAANSLGLHLEGLRDLTREACRSRNKLTREFEERNGVLYRTVAGVQPRDRVFPLLRLSYRIVWEEEGDNDGLVSLRSAMWKEKVFLGVIDADHLNQIGWWDWEETKDGRGRKSFEKSIQAFYLELCSSLTD